MEYNNRIHLIC